MPNSFIRNPKEAERVALSNFEETDACILSCAHWRHDLAVPSRICLPIPPVSCSSLLDSAAKFNCKLHRWRTRRNGLLESLTRLVHRWEFQSDGKLVSDSVVDPGHSLYGLCDQLLDSSPTCQMGRLRTMESPFDVQPIIYRYGLQSMVLV